MRKHEKTTACMQLVQVFKCKKNNVKKIHFSSSQSPQVGVQDQNFKFWPSHQGRSSASFGLDIMPMVHRWDHTRCEWLVCHEESRNAKSENDANFRTLGYFTGRNKSNRWAFCIFWHGNPPYTPFYCDHCDLLCHSAPVGFLDPGNNQRNRRIWSN